MRYANPVIPGFHPDPSICRAGDDFYLVTSSFEYFPGVPLFHSRDLVHWRQIGHCLTRDSQLPLQGTRSSGGIFAPTIRCHEGRFYMVTTHVSGGGNFYVWTDDPAGQWSEPIWVDQTGIDPSLLFDTDGAVYFTSQSEQGTAQCTLDIATGKRTSETQTLWGGTGGRYPEAPHLYHIGDWYYLMIAEGGTEYGHMETIARSRSPWGPFEGCPRNPILTHRNRGLHPIQATGHADLVQIADGSWWAVFLGVRPAAGYALLHHLGRETFLAPAHWDDEGWPVIGDNGVVEMEMDGPALAECPWPVNPVREEFAAEPLSPVWNFRGNPARDTWRLLPEGGLELRGTEHSLDDATGAAWIGQRQSHLNCRAATRLRFAPGREGEEAGLTALLHEKHHYEIFLHRGFNGREIAVRRRIGDLAAIVARESLPDGDVELIVSADPQSYRFGWRLGDEPPRWLAAGATRYLASEVGGGFTGVFFGLYATGTGRLSSSPAQFLWFDYQEGTQD